MKAVRLIGELAVAQAARDLDVREAALRLLLTKRSSNRAAVNA